MSRQIVNLLAILATILVNFLANFLPLNGLTTGEISGRFAVYFTPAGYVFSIWGVIYLWLLAYAIYQLAPAQRNDEYLQRIGWLFAYSCAANVAWLFLWHYLLFPLTVLAMLALLLLLIAIYLRLDRGRSAVSPATKWAAQIPFSIYLAWISVATIANVTVLLDYWDWSGWGVPAQAWFVVMLATGLAIAFAAAHPRRDIAYAAVIAWAYLGIAVKNPAPALVAIAGWAAAALAVLLLLAVILRKRPV